MKKWDAFISYASEDQDAVAQPLSKALQHAGFRIWLDEEQIRLGDSLREKLDRGLSKSRFGIVILSKSYMKKMWPQREMAALLNLEEEGHKVVLPVWHEVGKKQVAAFSPMVADRIAASTDDGIDSLARQLTAILVDPQYGSPSARRPSVARLFAELLDAEAQPKEIRRFLSYHPSILQKFSSLPDSYITYRIALKKLEADFWIMPSYKGGSVTPTDIFVILGSVNLVPVQSGRLAPEVEEVVSQVRIFLERIRGNYASDQGYSLGRITYRQLLTLPTMLDERRQTLVKKSAQESAGVKRKAYSLRANFSIICGRRSSLAEKQSQVLRTFNNSSASRGGDLRIMVRTYDALLDAAAESGASDKKIRE